MRRAFALYGLVLLIFVTPVQSKPLIDVGETGDTTYGDGVIFIDSQSNWGPTLTAAGESVRYTNPLFVANDACGFKFTLPSEDAVICISTYDDTNDDVLIYVDYWNGDTWQDSLLGTLTFRNRQAWQEDYFFVPQSVIDAANDSDVGQPGKQVAFKFWDSDGGWLTTSFAVDKVYLLNGTRNQLFSDGTPVKAIKFDPWVSTKVYGNNMDPEFIVRRYYSMGFNTVFLIAQFNNNEVCYDTQDTPFIYRSFGENFLPRLVQACDKYDIQLCAGMWGTRNTPVVTDHPDWGMKSSLNVQQGNMVCTASPYIDDYLIPMFKELHDVYGIKHFFSQEFWISGFYSFSDYMIDGFNTEYGYSYTRSELASSSGSLRDLWFNYNRMSQMRMIQEIHKIMDDDGIFVWHNVAGIDYLSDSGHSARTDFNWVRDFPTPNSFGSPYSDYLGNMILYVDVMYFEGLCPWEGMPSSQPVELWPGYDRMAYPVEVMPPEYLICETVGRSIQNRPNDKQEAENIYLSDYVAGGNVGFIYEQDGHGFEDSNFTVPQGLTNWNRDWWPLLIGSTEIAVDSFVSYTETTRRKARAYELPYAFGSANVKAALLVNMESSTSTYILSPSMGRVVYDVKAQSFLGSYTVQVPPQEVIFVVELDPGYDVTRPQIGDVTGFEQLTVSFTEPMQDFTIMEINNFHIDAIGNFEFLRSLNIGEATDDVLPMDGVATSSWEARTAVVGQSARYTKTGSGNASLWYMTVDPSTDYALDFVFYDNLTSTSSNVYIDYWDGGSWKDYPVATLHFDETNSWRTARGFMPASAFASAGDPRGEAGKQVAMRFWGPSTWLETSFAVDRIDIYRHEIPGAPTITAASIDPGNPSIVLLDVAGLENGFLYTLEAINTQDQAGNFTPWQETFEFVPEESTVVPAWELY